MNDILKEFRKDKVYVTSAFNFVISPSACEIISEFKKTNPLVPSRDDLKQIFLYLFDGSDCSGKVNPLTS